ncbi:MAG: hypothetical protein WAU81_14045 [Candidatus Aminicenantales bacterium]
MDMLNKEVREATQKKFDNETVFIEGAVPEGVFLGHILKAVAQDRK